MAVSLKIELQWWSAISRSLEISAKWIKEFWPFFEESLWLVEESVDKAFETKGASTWSRWKNLDARTTLARKRRYGYYKNNPNSPWILRWTWRMQESKLKIITELAWSLEYTDPKAKYHQFWYGVPKRSFIEFTPQLSAEITRALQKHINNVLWIANLR